MQSKEAFSRSYVLYNVSLYTLPFVKINACIVILVEALFSPIDPGKFFSLKVIE